MSEGMTLAKGFKLADYFAGLNLKVVQWRVLAWQSDIDAINNLQARKVLTAQEARSARAKLRTLILNGTSKARRDAAAESFRVTQGMSRAQLKRSIAEIQGIAK